MKKLLQSGWLIPLLGTLLYLGTTYFLLDPTSLKIPARAATTEDEAAVENALTGTPWDFTSPELDRMIRELKEQKEKLAARETELNEYAARLAAERAELNNVTQQVYQLQTDFNRVVTYVSQKEAETLKRQAKVFATMTPSDAARVLSEMTDDQIVRLLMFMSEEEMANILAVLAKPGPENAKRAAELSERLRLSVEAPAAGKSPPAAKPTAKAATSAASPVQELARLNRSADPGQPADFKKLARGYAALPPAQAVSILKTLQDEQMAAILAEFTEEQTAPFLVELAKTNPGGPQRAARVHELLLQKLNSGHS